MSITKLSSSGFTGGKTKAISTAFGGGIEGFLISYLIIADGDRDWETRTR